MLRNNHFISSSGQKYGKAVCITCGNGTENKLNMDRGTVYHDENLGIEIDIKLY